MERYPVLDLQGNVKGFIASSAEFTVIHGSRGSSIILWLDPYYGVEISSMVRNGVIEIEDIRIEYARLMEDIPWPLGYTALPFLHPYVAWAAEQLRDNLAGKTIMVNFSGGKDSVSVLLVLGGLLDYIDSLKIYAVYSHMPFIEAEGNIDFALNAAKKLGVEIELMEADRKLMYKRLTEEGLPYRGRRWCTYMKLKPIKMLRKTRRPEIVADGDRLSEAYKRFSRLYQMSPKKPRLYTGGRIKPIYVWTLLDTVFNTRSSNLVHPDYLKGLPRVACTLCPYKALHEFREEDLSGLEDPGVIEEAIQVSYRKRYLDENIPWEEFRTQHLWRYHPALAREIYRLKKRIEKERNLQEVRSEGIKHMYRSLWANPLPGAKKFTPEEALQRIAEVVGSSLKRTLRIVNKLAQ
ncbi:MAG: hypothetical protein DSY37_04160 [Hyperthermus sp.]|nr:MAG: hypothetical protein DSY37_04160 [Hyperthermus sp.]